MVRRLAIVPARGGSKRIPGKNIRDFCGRPMMSYILDTARQSQLFEDIHVSTDSAEIADVATALGFAPAFLRPRELADDHTPLMPVLRHSAASFAAAGKRHDEVWLLMASAPLIETSDLVGAARLFADAGSEMPVLSVAAYPSPVEWAFRKDTQGRLVPVQPQALSMRSQDIEPCFYDTGSFCVFSARAVLSSSDEVHQPRYLGYPLPRRKAVDIDDLEDFDLVEALYAAQAGRKP